MRTKRTFMPSGRASADRTIHGCWLYQQDAVVFIGEKQPYYWVYLKDIQERGMDFWMNHLGGKSWARTGWSREEVLADFDVLVRKMMGARLKSAA